MDPNLDTNNKLQKQRRHARKRARQRYGLTFTKDVRRDMETLIRTGQFTFIKPCERGYKVLELTYQNVTYTIVYDSGRRNIVTFLTPKA